ncbi:MAG: MOSC domain-containing protein [Gammaproteobacteria bacterium]|nr:MOSC domain-containing protein [Gammaproteobacteria bacterium]
MRLQSLNISRSKAIFHKGEEVQTGIFKAPAKGPLMARTLGIEGDEQADLVLHGGIDKAVYAFPSEHYSYYQNILSEEPYSPGQFGENLTTEGLLESAVRIGNRYRVGEAVFEVSQPRSPCYKFAIKMGSVEALSLCIGSAKTGFYLRVLREGIIQSGDEIETEYINDSAPTVEEIHALYYLDKNNLDGLTNAVSCNSLAEVFIETFKERIRQLGARLSP